jgi:phosphatidylserine decarboxylase
VLLFWVILQIADLSCYYFYISGFLGIILFSFLLLFFRNPKREVIPDSKMVFAPADGRIVAIEEIFEKEYLSQNCLKVSIFMSITNVHVNRYSVSGIIRYTKYHPGKYFIASHPKSSELNEHHSTVVETPEGILIMIKQIAGAVARRVICYAMVGEKVIQGNDIGFIKFGSRVDLFLPLNAKILVGMNEKVKGNITAIAHLN